MVRRSRTLSIAAASLVAGLGAIGLTGCGGSGISAQEKLVDDSSRAARFDADQLTLSLYCMAQLQDGSGHYAAASAALDDAIKIARNHPAQYRAGLTDTAQELHSCDPQMSDLAFNVVQTLPS